MGFRHESFVPNGDVVLDPSDSIQDVPQPGLVPLLLADPTRELPFAAMSLVVPNSVVQGANIAEDPLADVGVQAAIGVHVDPAAELVLELVLDGDQVEEAAAGREADQKVEIALGSGLTTGEGAEDAHVRATMALGHAPDLVAPRQRIPDRRVRARAPTRFRLPANSPPDSGPLLGRASPQSRRPETPRPANAPIAGVARQLVRIRWATISTWCVCGNMSKAATRSTA